jgi:hypothetical protein
MEIHCNHHTTVKDVQQQFTNCFPLLQLTFYRKRPDSKPVKVNEQEQLRSLVKGFHAGTVQFTRDTTVTAFQNKFQAFGFNVQVFRRFGSFYIATSLTDDWSLERQNLEASLIYIPSESLGSVPQKPG